jgi:transposase
MASSQTTSQPKPSSDWRERRRLQAWELGQKDWSQTQIAEALGVSRGAVSQWFSKARDGGVSALEHRPSPGAVPKVSREALQRLPELLGRGAESWGFSGAVWTCGRVAEIIEREWGVRYDESHVGRLLRELGWSRQKPMRRALQRNEEAIEKWEQERLPALKKGRKRRAAA